MRTTLSLWENPGAITFWQRVAGPQVIACKLRPQAQGKLGGGVGSWSGKRPGW